jgi:hypothetical protein
MLKCVCENEGLRILVKWVYEQNQVVIMQEFVNLNISRSILIDLVKNVYQDASQESLKFLIYSAIIVTTVLQMVLIIENTVRYFFYNIN